MSQLELPENLVAELVGNAPLGAWVASLPALLADVAASWALTVGRPYQPGGATSWTAPARDGAGRPLALKIAHRHPEARHEAEALADWDGRGAVRLVRSRVVGDSNVLLLERCEPGTLLRDALPAAAQDAVLAGVLRRLWIEPAAHRYQPLSDMCARWADDFEERVAGDPGLARAGVALFRELPASATDEVLLHTDLHPGNVLASTREPWLAIDPKPHAGDPTYDALQHMLNSPDRLVADPLGFGRRLAALLGLDPVRLRHWLFARCVLEGPGRPWLAAVARAVAP
ncbi:MAG: kinase [Streptosporangiales bacterium]|nr:kinase [Streptosporangiales bacterium]